MSPKSIDDILEKPHFTFCTWPALLQMSAQIEFDNMKYFGLKH